MMVLLLSAMRNERNLLTEDLTAAGLQKLKIMTLMLKRFRTTLSGLCHRLGQSDAFRITGDCTLQTSDRQ